MGNQVTQEDIGNEQKLHKEVDYFNQKLASIVASRDYSKLHQII